MPPERPLLMIVERYLQATGMPPTNFGRLAVSDPRFVRDLRLGRLPGRRVRTRVENFMQAHVGEAA